MLAVMLAPAAAMARAEAAGEDPVAAALAAYPAHLMAACARDEERSPHPSVDDGTRAPPDALAAQPRRHLADEPPVFQGVVGGAHLPIPLTGIGTKHPCDNPF